MKKPDEESGERVTGRMSRRGFITAAGMVAVGGVLTGGAIAAVTGAKEAAPGTPPPLPWPWMKMDPMEAGRRAFRNYHAKGG